MKYFFVLAMGLIATVSSFGQSSSPFSVGISTSADVNYRYLINTTDGSSLSPAHIDGLNDVQKPKWSHTTGIALVRQWNQNIQAELGLNYSSMGYQLDMNNLVWEDQIDPTRGFVQTTSEPVRSIRRHSTNFNYLSLPTRVIYVSNFKNVGFVTSLGVSPSFLIESQTVTKGKEVSGERYRDVSPTHETFNSFNLLATASVGLDWRLIGNFKLRTELSGRYGLLNIIDSPIGARLYNVGLNASLYYNLKG